MKINISPRAAARVSALVMTTVLFGMAAFTIFNVIESRSAIGGATRSIEVGELYTDVANDITLSALYLARYTNTRDHGDLLQFVGATQRAYADGNQIRAVGTDSDRAALDEIASKYSDAMALSESQMAAIAAGRIETFDAGMPTVANDVATDISKLADGKRDSALDRTHAFQKDLNRSSFLTIIAFALGLPMIAASYLVTRHYEHKESIHKADVERLQQAALTDGLTGLANHRAFQEDLRREVARAGRLETPLSVAMIDVDDFKEINDSRGHAHGDQVLAQLAKVMTYVRSNDRAYRVGGDEFALIMSDTEQESALSALRRLCDSVASSVDGTTISIGVSTVSQGDYRADGIRDHADAALYEAKHRGKNQVAAYVAELDEGSELTAAKMQAVRRVLKSGDVSMWFQPIFRIGSSKLLAFEALLRLPGEPEIEGPQEAFEMAQHMGRTRDLDLICISAALENARDLPADAKLFMNIDPATLMHSDFAAEELLSLALEHNVDPSKLAFEITEQTQAPISRIAKQVEAMRACGFSIALDDVGSGNSGLEMMRLIKFDYVKIDRSVVLDALDGGPGRAVILAIVAFARETGAFMIAEGIETQEMLESIKFDEHGLKKFWIQGVQGFLMGEPGDSIKGFLPKAAA